MLNELFGSRTRVGILRVLLVAGAGEYRLLELKRLVGTSISSVQKELDRLEAIGLASSKRIAGARVITVNQNHPLAEPIRKLLEADEEHTTSTAVAASVNPYVRPKLEMIADACRRHGALKAALVGSATQPQSDVVLNDLDILVRLPEGPAGASDRYFGLLEELERIMGMPVEIIDEAALTNPVLRQEFEATQVVLYEAA